MIARIEHMDGDTQASVQAALAMDTKALDDWYEANVGYRLLVDEPSMSMNEHRSFVAAMMYLQQLPQGVDTLGAEEQVDMIEDFFEAQP